MWWRKQAKGSAAALTASHVGAVRDGPGSGWRAQALAAAVANAGCGAGLRGIAGHAERRGPVVDDCHPTALPTEAAILRIKAVAPVIDPALVEALQTGGHALHPHKPQHIVVDKQRLVCGLVGMPRALHPGVCRQQRSASDECVVRLLGQTVVGLTRDRELVSVPDRHLLVVEEH